MADTATATMENLLRAARSEVGAGTAFAALFGDGSPDEIVSIPAAGATEGLASDELEALVRQAVADPEFLHARVFVRSVRMGQALTLAVAPLRNGVGRGMIGVVAGPDHRFEPAQLDLLERLAQRVLRHLEVVQRLSGCGALDEALRQRAGSPPGGPGPAEPLERSPSSWWAEADPLTGLSGLGQFFSRAGRMLGSDDPTTGALALVVVEVPDPLEMPNAARALRAQLRFSDLLVRVDFDLLAVAIMLLPTAKGDAVEERLAAAVRSALERSGSVRAVHVVATSGDRREVDELLREAVARLRDRS